jgi:hypothetical protein
VGSELGVGITVGAGVGTGAGEETFIPFDHTNFLPDLIQVNLNPFNVEVAPTLLHGSPCFTAPKAVFVIISEPTTAATISRFTTRMRKGKRRLYSDSTTESLEALIGEVIENPRIYLTIWIA